MTTSQPLTHPDWVKLNLEAVSATDAIRELHAGLSASPAISKGALFLDDLLARQALDATFFDSAIALAHVRTTAVSRIVCAVGRSDQEVHFTRTHPSIRLVILLGVPHKAVTEYLRWLARLAQALRKPEAREELLNAPDPEAFGLAWARLLGVS